MGLALTEHLVAKGWKVAMCDIKGVQGRHIANKLGKNVLFLDCDVSSYAAQTLAFEEAWAHWGRIDFGNGNPASCSE